MVAFIGSLTRINSAGEIIFLFRVPIAEVATESPPNYFGEHQQMAHISISLQL